MILEMPEDSCGAVPARARHAGPVRRPAADKLWPVDRRSAALVCAARADRLALAAPQAARTRARRMAELAIAAARPAAGRPDRPARRRLEWGVGRADRERGGAVRLSAVRLLLSRRHRAAGLAARAASEAARWRCPTRILLLLSSVAAWWGEKGIEARPATAQALAGLGLAFLLGAVFAACRSSNGQAKTYGLGTSSYASLYFVTTGFHMAHVIVGLVVLAAAVRLDRARLFQPAPPDRGRRPASSTGTSSTSSGCSFSPPITSPPIWGSADERRRARDSAGA